MHIGLASLTVMSYASYHSHDKALNFHRLNLNLNLNLDITMNTPMQIGLCVAITNDNGSIVLVMLTSMRDKLSKN